MDTFPKLGDRVIVRAEAHPFNGRTGEVSNYHAKLDAVFVCFLGVEQPQLVPTCYLEAITDA